MYKAHNIIITGQPLGYVNTCVCKNINTHVDNNLKYVLYTNIKKTIHTCVGLLEILNLNKTDKYVIIINAMSLKKGFKIKHTQ